MTDIKKEDGGVIAVQSGHATMKININGTKQLVFHSFPTSGGPAVTIYIPKEQIIDFMTALHKVIDRK